MEILFSQCLIILLLLAMLVVFAYNKGFFFFTIKLQLQNVVLKLANSELLSLAVLYLCTSGVSAEKQRKGW